MAMRLVRCRRMGLRRWKSRSRDRDVDGSMEE